MILNGRALEARQTPRRLNRTLCPKSTRTAASFLPRGRALVLAAFAVIIGACETSGPTTQPEHPPTEATPSTGPVSPSPPAARATSPEVAGEIRAPSRTRVRAEYAQPFTAWEIHPILSIERLDSDAGGAAAPAAPASGTPSAVVTPESALSASLRARYAALSERLEHSPFQQRLYLESVESSRALQGDVYALLDHPFATVSDAFASPAHWCDVLILHLNVKYCHATTRGNRTTLSVAVGRKYDQPLADTSRVELAFSAAASTADYLQINLDASQGPLGTSNYHIALEAVGLEDGRAFLHIQFSYGYGFPGRLAMRVYLATSGRGKVGFTRIDGSTDGTPRYIGGVRGAVERNTMRYYLAIDAYLDALATPEPQRFEQSLERCFAATERYALQLHEVDRNAYFAMKRHEYLRQETLQ